jgi:hypothetical protein
MLGMSQRRPSLTAALASCSHRAVRRPALLGRLLNRQPFDAAPGVATLELVADERGDEWAQRLDERLAGQL